MSLQLSATTRRAVLTLALLIATSGAAGAQTAQGWSAGIYPVFVWIPTSIDIEMELPPGDGGDIGSIVESRFDGAYLGGFYASKGWFRTDVDVVWAAVGGDRLQTPEFSVDVDLIYFHATGGVRMAPGLYATAGVRRLALKYDIKVAGFPNFERKPGIWDPLVGVGYHYEGEGRPIEFHATFEAGGFGAGADRDYGLMGRLDWKPIPHFGVTAGYNFLHLRFTDTALGRDFRVKQSVHGPVLGIGFYF
jgi:hypothetical protein